MRRNQQPNNCKRFDRTIHLSGLEGNFQFPAFKCFSKYIVYFEKHFYKNNKEESYVISETTNLFNTHFVKTCKVLVRFWLSITLLILENPWLFFFVPLFKKYLKDLTKNNERHST